MCRSAVVNSGKSFRVGVRKAGGGGNANSSGRGATEVARERTTNQSRVWGSAARCSVAVGMQSGSVNVRPPRS
jgi:hypothetical protein